MPTAIVLNLLGPLPVFLPLPPSLPIKPPKAERALDFEESGGGGGGGGGSELMSRILPSSQAASALADLVIRQREIKNIPSGFSKGIQSLI